MRRASTRTEGLLWEHLRHRRLDGLRFRRQHVLGRFIADFYCAERRLVVEVDGPVHEARAARDAERSRILGTHGITVVRFTNDDVLSNVRAVLQKIRSLPLTLPPLRQRRGGPGG